MYYLQYLVEQPQTHRLGLTFLHFLWQGAVVAMIVAVATWALRRRSAATRYFVLLLAFGVMALLPVVTFCMVEPPAARFSSVTPVEPEAKRLDRPPVLPPEVQVSERGLSSARWPDVVDREDTLFAEEGGEIAHVEMTTLTSIWESWIEGVWLFVPWGVVGWGIGVLFLSMRLTVKWLCVGRLVRRQVQPVTDSVKQMAERLCESLRVRQAIRLLESALVSVPTVVGVFRPVVLLPASALVGLSPAQLESLLAHELAHIRRHDYLINMLQCVVETLLFYHPAVWWISERIRAERENCCDDIAISGVGSRPLYAQALLDMAKLRSRERSLAVAASGSDLRSRIHRIIGLSSEGPSRFVPWWVGMLVLSTFLVAFSAPSIERVRPTVRASDGNTEVLEHGGQHGSERLEPPPRAEATFEKPGFRLFDPFAGRLELDWTVIRPDPTHVSLTRNPGKLTITTQVGSIYAVVRPSSRAVPAKNIHLIANPAAEDDDFVVTTCIESFRPTLAYQQAGLVVYDDDDNYLKWDLERTPGSLVLVFVRETNRVAVNEYYDAPSSPERDRLWLRLTKRGRLYEYSYSTNGREFVIADERLWGSGPPRWVGILAKHAEAPKEIDAAFDFFEVRSLTPEEKQDGRHVDREKLQGIWEVASFRHDGKSSERLSLAEVVFEGRTLTIVDGATSSQTAYALDVTTQPRAMRLIASFEPLSSGPVQAAYQLEDDRLLIYFDPRGGPSGLPRRLVTEDGDGLSLLTLVRMPAVEVAALERNSRFRDRLFAHLDNDEDEHLTLDEFVAGNTTSATIKRATDLFQARDQDGDGKLSWDEFGAYSSKALFHETDLNADATVSVKEFSLGEMKSASVTRTEQVFKLMDKNGDGSLSREEYVARPAEAWFAKYDTNEDGRLSLDEFPASAPWLVRVNRHTDAFAALDSDGDGSLTVAEYTKRSEEARFIIKDLDGDGKLTLEQYGSWKHREDPSAAADEFARRDANGDGLLDFEETSYGPANSKFWEADSDGDYRLSLDEFKTVRPTDAPGQIDAMFKSVDRNRDQSISLAEFESQPTSG